MAVFQVESTNRWDAMALCAKLSRYSWYLVELTDRRWRVCVRFADGAETEVPSDLLRAIDQWRLERAIGPVPIQAGARPGAAAPRKRGGGEQPSGSLSRLKHEVD